LGAEEKWEAENIGGTPTIGTSTFEFFGLMPLGGREEDHLRRGAIETDKYDLEDSPSDGELPGADEDDANDYSDDSIDGTSTPSSSVKRGSQHT
jgi:hypothetical protein